MSRPADVREARRGAPDAKQGLTRTLATRCSGRVVSEPACRVHSLDKAAGGGCYEARPRSCRAFRGSAAVQSGCLQGRDSAPRLSPTPRCRPSSARTCTEARGRAPLALAVAPAPAYCPHRPEHGGTAVTSALRSRDLALNQHRGHHVSLCNAEQRKKSREFTSLDPIKSDRVLTHTEAGTHAAPPLPQLTRCLKTQRGPLSSVLTCCH